MEALVGTSWIDRISSLPDPLESFHNLTSLARASLSSFILGSSYILEVAVAAPKQISSSLRGEEMAEAD